MGWFANRMRRGMINRSYDQICAEIGSAGAGSAFFAIAIGAATYPDAVYGTAEWDHFNEALPKPIVDSATALRIAGAWVDGRQMSWADCIERIYGCEPSELMGRTVDKQP